MQPEPLDIIALMVALLAFITSKDVAHVAGPYAAIALLACAGAALSLSGSETRMGPMLGAWFVFTRVFLAVVITVALAEAVQAVFPGMKPRYTMAPIAFAIGWIKDYNQVRTWLGGLIDRFATKRVEQDGK